MYELTIISNFAAAHNLLNYQGACEALHGHNWKIEVTVRGSDMDQAGMVIDFGNLKKMTRSIVDDELDHTYLNEFPAFEGLSPSSERIAKYIFNRLEELLRGSSAKVWKVVAWESDTAKVAYLGESREGLG